MTNASSKSESVSRRDEQIIALALREVQPEFAAEFEPITAGPILTILALAALGLVAAIYLLLAKLRKLLFFLPRLDQE
jgi:hypothetical protein